MRRALLAALVLVSLSLLAPPRATACSIVPGPTPHTIDASLAAQDTTPPSTPVVTQVRLVQDHDSPPGDSCGDLSSLVIDLAPVTDNLSTADKIGYEINVVEGRLPRALTLPVAAVRPGPYSSMSPPSLIFVFGASNENVDFKLSVTAIDEAGNRSAASLPMQEIGRAGCNASGSSANPSSLSLLLLVLCALVLVQPRRS